MYRLRSPRRGGAINSGAVVNTMPGSLKASLAGVAGLVMFTLVGMLKGLP